jgi:hypothetical protein
LPVYKGQSESSQYYLASMVWCTMSSSCKFCRVCMMQFRSGRDNGFYITIMYRATQRLLCSNSSPRKAFLSTRNHCTLQISLRMTLGCCLHWNWASRWCVTTMEDIKSNAMVKLQKKPSTGASNSGRIKCCHILYHYSVIPLLWKVLHSQHMFFISGVKCSPHLLFYFSGYSSFCVYLWVGFYYVFYCVYQTKCTDCLLKYFRKMERTFYTRYKEHTQVIRNINGNSGYLNHIMSRGHTLEYNQYN